MPNFCLSLPDDLKGALDRICSQRSISKTSYIRQAIGARIQQDLTGRRYCASGEICMLSVVNNPDRSSLTGLPPIDNRFRGSSPK